jgi:hypothetical protein
MTDLDPGCSLSRTLCGAGVTIFCEVVKIEGGSLDIYPVITVFIPEKMSQVSCKNPINALLKASDCSTLDR